MQQASTAKTPLVSQPPGDSTGTAMNGVNAYHWCRCHPSRPPRTVAPSRLPDFATQEVSASGYSCNSLSDYEAPYYSLDSQLSCGRPDSLELDPDLHNPAASEYQMGLLFAQQAIRTCHSEESLSKFVDLRGAVGSGDNGPQLFALDTLTACTPNSSVFTERSGARADDSGDDNKLRKSAGLKRGTALISSAFKVLSATVVERLEATRSGGRHLSGKSTCTGGASYSTGDHSSTTELDMEARHASPESDSEAGLVHLTMVPWSTSPSLRAKFPKEDVAGKAHAALTLSNNEDAMATSLIRLPSYHRNLRKRTYPPRVRYSVRQDSSQALVGSHSVPTSPLLDSRGCCPSGKLPCSRPRATSEGHRAPAVG